MAEPPRELTQLFLPAGAPTASKPPPKTQPGQPAQRPSDPESTRERQLARRLGDYGADIVRDEIKVDYSGQLEKWKGQIRRLATLFSTALDQHAAALQRAKEQKQARADFEAFIFSLVTAGVMRWAGTWMQYKTYPRAFSDVKERTINLRIRPYKLIFPQVLELDYNKQMAAFVGGMVQDVGGGTVDYFSRKNSLMAALPEGPEGRGTRVRIYESELIDALEVGTQVVKGQMDDAVIWMEGSPVFGEAWAANAQGNEARARLLIGAHLKGVRNEWARRWPYFGQDPKPLNGPAVSNDFERALWAPYVDGFYSEAFGRLNKSITPEQISLGKDYYLLGPMGEVLRLEQAILDRLTEVNVVPAENVARWTKQMERAEKGEAPKPTVLIEGDLDMSHEVADLWKWAREYPKMLAQANEAKKNSSPGAPRPLPAIPKFGP